jgi:drug/metabolite transporter (DMT)-like permease
VISRARGVVELVAAALLFGLMAYLAKQTTHALDGAQTAFVRFLIGAVIVAGHFALRRERPQVVRRDLLFMRGFFGGSAVLLYFASLRRLPVGTATLLNYTAPVFSATFAAIFLGEVLPRLRVLAMAVAGCGVALVVVGQGRALGGAYGWQLVGLASAVLAGMAITSIRAARRTDGAWEVFGAFCLVGALVTAPFAIAGWQPPGARLWLLLGAVGCVAAAGQMLMTHALAAVDAASASAGVIGQLTVVTAMALGHFLDGEPFTPMSFLGACLTLLGVAAASAVGHGQRLPADGWGGRVDAREVPGHR